MQKSSNSNPRRENVDELIARYQQELMHYYRNHQAQPAAAAATAETEAEAISVAAQPMETPEVAAQTELPEAVTVAVAGRARPEEEYWDDLDLIRQGRLLDFYHPNPTTAGENIGRVVSPSQPAAEGTADEDSSLLDQQFPVPPPFSPDRVVFFPPVPFPEQNTSPDDFWIHQNDQNNAPIGQAGTDNRVLSSQPGATLSPLMDSAQTETDRFLREEEPVTDQGTEQPSGSAQAQGTGESINPGSGTESSTEYPMSTGYLQVAVTSGRNALPIENAAVTITRSGENGEQLVRLATTDSSGRTPVFPLPAVSADLSMKPGNPNPFTLYNVRVDADGFRSIDNLNIPVFGGVTSVQNVSMIPLPEKTTGNTPLVLGRDRPQTLL